MKSTPVWIALLLAATTALSGCTDKDRELAKRKGNAIDTFEPGKPPTSEEIEERARKRRARKEQERAAFE